MGHVALIGSTEAARRLGISRSHFNRKVNAGDIPHEIKMPGVTGVFMFSTDVIAKLAKDKK